MPTLKSVYFAPDNKWFNTLAECESYELLLDVTNQIKKVVNTDVKPEMVTNIAKVIITNYEMFTKTPSVIDPKISAEVTDTIITKGAL